MNHRRLGLIILFLFLPLSASEAGWQKLAQNFRNPVQCGFFFNERVGFVGIDGVFGIWKTTDGGNSWKKATMNPSDLPGRLSSIFMRNQTEGWASIENLESTPMLFHTTDGGLTWNIVNSLIGTSTCVYHTKANAVVVTSRATNTRGALSSDGGATWQQNIFKNTNGIDFVSDLNGVITGIDRDVWYRTIDGGKTWTSFPPPYEEAWGIYGDTTSRIFYTAGEGIPRNQGTRIGGSDVVRSTDFGVTWQTITKLGIRTTGHIDGKGSILYVQADVEDSLNVATGRLGLFRSTDGGQNWKSVGGPSKIRDSRFVVTGCGGGVVYAFDESGNVWKTRDGGDGQLVEPDIYPEFSGDSVGFSGPICLTTFDSLTFTNRYCSADTIIEIRFLDDLLNQSGALTLVGAPTLPKVYNTGEGERLLLQWKPSLLFHTDTILTTKLRIRFFSEALGGIVDTVITVYAHAKGSPPSYQPKAFNLILRNGIACQVLDTSFTLRNTGCDTLLITGGALGPQLEVFDPLTGMPAAYPIRIAPDSLRTLRVRITRTKPGSFSESLRLALTHQGIRDTAAYEFSGFLNAERALLSIDALDLLSTPICRSLDTVILVRNGSCDTLTVTNTQLFSGSQLTILGSSGGPKLAPGDSLLVRIRLNPSIVGPLADSLLVMGDQNGFTIRLAVPILGLIRPDDSRFLSSISPDTLQFADRTRCDLPDTLDFFLANPGCTGYAVRDIRLLQNVPAFTIVTTSALPDTLADGDTLWIRVAVNNSQVGAFNDTLRIRYLFEGGVNIDTLLPLHVVIDYGSRILSVSSELRDFGEIGFCQMADTLIPIRNLGCDTLIINSLDVLGPFSLGPASLPITLGPDSSISVRVLFTPEKAAPDNGQLLVGSNGDLPSEVLIPLRGSATPTDTATFRLLLTSASVAAGGIASISLVPSLTRAASPLTSLSFTLSYNGDLLTYLTDSSGGRTTITTGPELRTVGKTSYLPVRLRGSAIDLDSTLPLLTLRFRTTLSDSFSTPIIMKELMLNDNAANFQRCILGGRTTGTEFPLRLVCGDSLISEYLRHNLRAALRIISVTPNPTSGGKGIGVLIDHEAGQHSIRVIDSKGMVAWSGVTEFKNFGIDRWSIPTQFASGSYTIELLRVDGQALPAMARFIRE